MKKIILFVICCFSYFAGSGQEQQLSKPLTSEEYLHVLGGSKDSLYSEILQSFDSYIAHYPADYIVQIERCSFIASAYYDSEEDYNPHEDESEQCLEDLVAQFPGVPEVMLYKMDFVYGDSELVFLNGLVTDFNNHREKWKGKGIWKVYKRLADHYDNKKEHSDAIRYAESAVAQNDTLDLSLLLAENYKELNQNKKAIDVLTAHLDSSDRSWSLNQKGKLLLELGAPDKAIRAFRIAAKDTNSWIDEGSLAQAMIQNGLYTEARAYLVKDAKDEWNRAEKLRNLFNYDIKYSPADSAKATYRALLAEGFWSDPVGIYRLRLFLHAPLLGWNVSDMLHILLLLSLFVAIFIIPYLWILPIYYLGTYFKNRGMIVLPSQFRWGLRSFWLASSLILFVEIAASIFVRHDQFFFGNDESTAEHVSKALADYSLVSLSGFLLITLLFLKRSDIGIFWGHIWKKQKSISTGIGLAFLLRFGLGIYVYVLKACGVEITIGGSSSFFSISDNVTSINQFYHPVLGFLFVVLLVPVYEEILFRGVFLNACQKHMKFILANLVQAAIFALIHFEWKLIPFYLAFGLLAGHFRQKTQSLAPGISMHMTNNFFAFIAIALRS